jgi:tetratricopeptide (TPR) repeat protein
MERPSDAVERSVPTGDLEVGSPGSRPSVRAADSTSTVGTDRSAPGPARQRHGPRPRWRPQIATVLALLLSGMLFPALLLWRSARSVPAKTHWDAVARGQAYLHAGRADRAFACVSAIRDDAPGAGEAMAIAGFALIRMNEYRAARLAFDRAIELQPNQFEALVALADINLGLGNGLRGIDLLQRAARLRSGEFNVWLTMGKVQSDLGDLTQAIAAYERALAVKPTDRDALIGLIGALTNSSRSARAAAWVAQALERYPDDPAILGLAARTAFDTNHPDDTIALAERALGKDRHNLNALLAQASAFLARSQCQQALVAAERAAAVAPNDRAVLQLLQSIETKLGLTQRAARTRALSNLAETRVRRMGELSKLIDRHPDKPEYPWKLGEAAREASMFLLASRCYQAALALDPHFQPARASLAKLHQEHPELAGD